MSETPGWDAYDAAVPRPRRLPRGAGVAWLAASLGTLAAFALTRRRLRRACAACPVRRVAGTRVRVAERAGPMVVGVLDPQIVLPRWAVDGPADELLLIVRHEREHVAAGDPWLLALATAAVAVMPWSAALWWQHRRLRLAVETDCDARVLAAGGSRESYGRVLLRTASHASSLAGALAWGGRWSHLERRILAMTARRPRHALARALPLAAFALALAAAACALASSGAADGAAADAPQLEMGDGRLMRTDHLPDGSFLTVMGPVPGAGRIGLAYAFDPPRTRTSPPPTVLPAVNRVVAGSPAEQAGLREGDVIVAVNGRDAREPYLIADRSPGTVYTVRIRRDGAERDLRLVVGPPYTRAESERLVALESACLRPVETSPAGPEQNARRAECNLPF
jgi:hypothetical protein